MHWLFSVRSNGIYWLVRGNTAHRHCLPAAHIPSLPFVKTHNYVSWAWEWERARNLTSEYEWIRHRERWKCCAASVKLSERVFFPPSFPLRKPIGRAGGRHINSPQYIHTNTVCISKTHADYHTILNIHLSSEEQAITGLLVKKAPYWFYGTRLGSRIKLPDAPVCVGAWAFHILRQSVIVNT